MFGQARAMTAEDARLMGERMREQSLVTSFDLGIPAHLMGEPSSYASHRADEANFHRLMTLP